MKTSITRRYEFSSGHYLPTVPREHRCSVMHGHNYVLEVTLTGDVVDGFIADFWDVDKEVLPVIDAVDHKVLNNVQGLTNPTAENIAAWFLSKLSPIFGGLSNVRVYETPSCWADVSRE